MLLQLLAKSLGLPTTAHSSFPTNFLLHFAGNDCLFEFNFLSDLCYEVTDSGAFYTGRSWIDRGNIIRHSIFTNIVTTEKVYLGSASVQAIYLDDQVQCTARWSTRSLYTFNAVLCKHFATEIFSAKQIFTTTP